MRIRNAIDRGGGTRAIAPLQWQRTPSSRANAGHTVQQIILRPISNRGGEQPKVEAAVSGERRYRINISEGGWRHLMAMKQQPGKQVLRIIIRHRKPAVRSSAWHTRNTAM